MAGLVNRLLFPTLYWTLSSIKLSKLSIAALRRHKARQEEEERGALGAVWNRSLDLIFPNTLRGLRIPDNLVKRSFKPLMLSAGFEPEMAFTICATQRRASS